MQELARSEVESLTATEADLATKLRSLLVPKDPLADRAAVVEIRAGTGGERSRRCSRVTCCACISAMRSGAAGRSS